MNAQLKARKQPARAGEIDHTWFNQYLPRHPEALATALDRLRALENYYRRTAESHGFVLRKSRARKWSNHNHRAYMLLDNNHTVAAGKDYDLSLDEVAEFLGVKKKA